MLLGSSVAGINFRGLLLTKRGLVSGILGY
jgi:hypothetical protein